MPASYIKLWEIMKSQGIEQPELEKECKISSATFAKMKKGEYVAMDTLGRICSYLNCDFCDIVSYLPPEKYTDFRDSPELMRMLDSLRKALERYMADKKLSLKDVHQITGLSVNTIRLFLKGTNFSSASQIKLNRLGLEFSIYLQREMKTAGFFVPKGIPVEQLPARIGSRHSCRKCPALKVHTDFFGESTVVFPRNENELIQRTEASETNYKCMLEYEICMDRNRCVHPVERCSAPKTVTAMCEEATTRGIRLCDSQVETIPAKHEL